MAIGAGEKRFTFVDGEARVVTMMTATGSFDHRVIDGAVGARLMAAFKWIVENPVGIASIEQTDSSYSKLS